MKLPRLRQVALVAADLEAACARVERDFGLREPFHDPAVALFGLRNAVYAAGDTFLEVVTPIEEGTAAGRHLERRGGDAGYMAIFQVADLAAARRRVDALGVRVAWEVELEDIAALHLHPADVGGAIVSLDAADPPDSWRWGGGAPPHGSSIAVLTVRVPDPTATAARWGDLVGAPADGRRLVLGPQTVAFEEGDEGISGVQMG